MPDKVKKESYKDKHGTTRVGDFLRSIGKGDLLEKIGDVAGNIATGNIFGAISAAIGADKDLTPEQKDYAIKMAELDFQEAQEITKRWESDMTSDSWLSKNIRPYTLVFLSVSMIIFIAVESSVEGFVIPDTWKTTITSLAYLVYGAYFGSRGLEKIAKIIRK